MKKLMIAASAALCATVGFSAVESQNIVGYASVTIPAQKLTMIGVQFADVDGTTAINVQDLFKDPQLRLYPVFPELRGISRIDLYLGQRPGCTRDPEQT